MLLQADPGLAEVPGFSTERLESLSRSIEQKKHKLEADIQAYIKKKQRELAQYEQELLAQYREMERGETRESTDKNSMHAESQNAKRPTDSPAPPAQPVDTSLESRKEEEKAKRTKHTRVHKREKELCGLVTPIFLPLLDAGEGSPTKKEKKEEAA